MLAHDDNAVSGTPKHPGAVRMGIIAGLAHNIIVGSAIGTFSVLVHPVELRLGVTPEMTAVAITLVIAGGAILASVVGVLAARMPLRRLLAAGALLATCGWLLLALTASYPLYILAYGLLLGPSMALTGSVLPTTLVTRWFSGNRGIALGLVHLPILPMVMPIATHLIIERFGIEAVYAMLAGLNGLILLPAVLMVIEYPPGAEPAPARTATTARATPATSALTVPKLLRNPHFWAFTMAVGAINMSSLVLGAHLVPMAQSWGIERVNAALLASIFPFTGMIGSVLFGWIADRLGGGRTLALIAFDAGLLWAALLLPLPYAALAVVFGLIGLHGAGAIPSLSRGLADTFGQANFSRVFGLCTTASIPMTIVGVIGTASAYQHLGSYSLAIVGIAAFFAIAAPLGLYAARGRLQPPAMPSLA